MRPASDLLGGQVFGDPWSAQRTLQAPGRPSGPTPTIALRFWSDGQVDATRVFSQRSNVCGNSPAEVCSGPTVLIPGTCTTDINRDGDTGIQDFLTLLGGWGACR